MADTQEYSLQDITSINLNSSQYGKDINDRFEAIDENFKNIISSEFLKGEDGQNLSLVECELTEDSSISDLFVINGEEVEEVDYNWLIENIKESIKTRLNISGVELEEINNHEWDEGIVGSKLYLLCKRVEEKSIIISSLPYTHVDGRFANIKYDIDNIELYENLVDTSCTIIYKYNGFVSYTTTPTIYYDRNVGDGEFCWEINGNKSGLICRGPQGPSGVTNNTLILIIDKRIEEISDTKLHPILGICWWDGQDYSILTVDKAIKAGISLKSNIMCACFYGEKDASGNIFIVGLKNADDEGDDGDITITIPGNYVSGYIVSQTICFENEYYVYAGDKVCHIPALLELSSLSELMSKIGATPGTSKGLFVKFNPSNDEDNSAVALYTNDEKTAVLGAVKNGRSDSYETLAGKTLDIDFDTINCKGIKPTNIETNSIISTYNVFKNVTIKELFYINDDKIILDGYDVRLDKSSVLNIPTTLSTEMSTNGERHVEVSKYIKDIFIGDVEDDNYLYNFVFLYLPKSEDLMSGHTINLWWNNRVPVVLLNSDSEFSFPSSVPDSGIYWHCSAGDKKIIKNYDPDIDNDTLPVYTKSIRQCQDTGYCMLGKVVKSYQTAYSSFVILGEVPEYERLSNMSGYPPTQALSNFWVENNLILNSYIKYMRDKSNKLYLDTLKDLVPVEYYKLTIAYTKDVYENPRWHLYY